MEDAHICDSIHLPDQQKGMLFAVFDGHGGARVAMFAKKHIKEHLIDLEEFKNKDYKKALKRAFLEMDSRIGSEWYSKHTGCTACVVLLTPTDIICANIGDSRACMKVGD